MPYDSPCNKFILYCLQVVNIFNLFITYGDTFLPCPTSYDELYYEVIRVHQIFDNLYSMGELATYYLHFIFCGKVRLRVSV
jgi:hypothetical protein